MKTMADVIHDLELLLAWAKANPELPAPYDLVANWIPDGDVAKDVAAAFIRAVPKCKKMYGNNHFTINHQFTPLIEMMVIGDRAAVCERVVVGTREVPETTTPAHTEEIVEWKCGSILAPAEPAMRRQEENASIGEGWDNGALQS